MKEVVMTQNPFIDRVAFVTGAAGGIGQATAVAFAKQGASVAVADLSADRVRDTVRLIEEHGGKALALRCDVTSDEDVTAALERTVDTFGRLDYAFNNAGIEQPITPTADITDDDWKRILDVNTRGVFLCMKHEIPLMLANGGGAIVNNRPVPVSSASRAKPPMPQANTPSSA
jgi:NAD(P)-dependent dehydrogenase (short-subunit alcohol dehydrogenase family)